MLSHSELKLVSLVTLTVQTSVFVLMARKSRIPDSEGHIYRTSSAVLMLELTKLLVSSLMVFIETHKTIQQIPQASYSPLSQRVGSADPEDPIMDGLSNCDEKQGISTILQACGACKESLLDISGVKLLYPASAYAIQNVLQLRAASYLQPAIFQIFNQGKLIMTAIFAYIILKKALTALQWSSIVTLATGLAIVQLSSQNETISTTSSTNVSLGLALMLVVAVFSGFAGVYTELLLKKGNDFWVTNAQMAGFSLFPAVIMVFIESIEAGNCRIFEYFGGWAISTVLMNAAGGLLVSMVIKYADSIIKGFSLAAAVVLTVVINVTVMGSHFSSLCLFGIFVVLASVIMYNVTSLGNHGTKRTRSGDIDNQEDVSLKTEIETGDFFLNQSLQSERR